MRTFLKLLAVLFFAVIPSFIFAAETPPSGIEFNIRFFDRRIYYVHTDPIFVQITINNQSPETFRFKLADERAFSIDFDIRTMTNRPLAQADSLIRKRTVKNQIFFREIVIESGESFSFVEDLRDYVNFSGHGSFRVCARVYPELFKAAFPGTSAQTQAAQTASAIESNFLILTLRPEAIIGPDNIPLEMDIETGAVLVRQPLPPDEVVSYMIKARQASQWERFFLYLNLEAMLSRDPVQRRKWTIENEEGRRRMTAEYRQNLQNSIVDGDISVIPTSFDILETKYNNNEGTVTLAAKFRHINFTELRRYTYYLERKDNIWLIVDYTVQGIGTEAND